MLSETSQWHITMPVGGGIHAINKAVLLAAILMQCIYILVVRLDENT